MLSTRVRAAASAAALTAFVLLVGTAAFLAVQEDPAPPPTTTTTTTTTTVPLSAIAAAIAASLQANLEIAITPDEATCVANELLAVLPAVQLERLESLPAPFAALTDSERARLVRGVVRCVPPASAAALLGTTATTAPPLDLPDEG